MPNRAKSILSSRALWLIPLAALLAVLPLILKGNSSGHDQIFHIQGWYDAAQQLRHAQYPRWSFTSAWNAGEPRFLFYPPLSWLLGALLTLIFPPTACPTIFIAIALLTSGLTFYKLASEFASPNAALISSTLYLANPYMLFNAFERSAYAELLAAAWIPLLLLTILRPRPTIRAIAIPIALLWLTNAPAAVMGCYALALLVTLRLILALVARKARHPERTLNAVKGKSKNPEDIDLPIPPNPFQPPPPSPLRLALTCIAGTLLGLALPAFYLLPAAYERRFIQVTMAIIPGMRPQDNFLFTRTADTGHNGVNVQITLLALTLITLTFAALLTLWIKSKDASPARHADISAAARSVQRRDLQILLTLTFLAAVITFLLFPPSILLWLHVPELAFLQLPWRLLTLLTPILALTIALLLTRAKNLGAPRLASETWIRSLASETLIRSLASETWVRATTLTVALLLPTILGFYAFHLYSQFNPPDDIPAAIAARLSTHHGFPPTDEYTPTTADNDILRSNNPGFWLLPNLPNGQPANPNTPAPNTTPTATELNPAIDNDDTPIPIPQTLSTEAPHHLTLNLPQPATLVLNLRDYPNWDVTGSGPDTMSIEHYPAPARDDGLITMQLPRGKRDIDITWHRTPDQTLGLAISALALIFLALLRKL
jgi:hypothetical protein